VLRSVGLCKICLICNVCWIVGGGRWELARVGGRYVVGRAARMVMDRDVKVCSDELELVLVDVKDTGETLPCLIVVMHITSLRATAYERGPCRLSSTLDQGSCYDHQDITIRP